MTILIIGIVLIIIAAAAFWLNTNSPVQTPIPIVAGPIGIVLVLLWVGGKIL